MASPQAVVFDFGGVLVGEPEREVIYEYIQSSLNLSSEEFKKANLEKMRAFKEGKTAIEFWFSYAENKGIQLPQDWEEGLVKARRQSIHISSEMYALVNQLKEEQLTIALLSNIDKPLATLLRNEGLYAPFDPCLLSYEIGAWKPDLQSYEILLAELDLPASDIVFIDDKVENVDAAKTLGIDAILFESVEGIRAELKKRGMLKDYTEYKRENVLSGHSST